MPIYMDRHDVSKDVTAETVAKLHQEDLKIQHNYNCRGLTYWYDDVRKTAFCLVEAPDKESLTAMHKNAHGEVPNRVIEVDANIVESFLGRIEDPENFDNTEQNIIKEPAFRTIMVTGIKPLSFLNMSKDAFNSSVQRFNLINLTTIEEYKGSVVNRSNDCFMVSFKSVSDAKNCALKVHDVFLEWKKITSYKYIELKTGISTGLPITDKENIFGDTIKTAERLHHISTSKIMTTTEVKELYQNEETGDIAVHEQIEHIHPDDEKFLNQLMDCLEENWTKSEFRAVDLSSALNISKSKLYRKIISLAGNSPNAFIKDFRLKKALQYFRLKKGNISEIAYETGFGSPSYFTKCFQQKYGINPTEYLELQQN